MAFLRASLTVPSSTIASSLPCGSVTPCVWRPAPPGDSLGRNGWLQCRVQMVTRRGAALFILMSVVWGLPYMLIKVAVRDLSPAVIVEGRTAIGALVLVPLAL